MTENIEQNFNSLEWHDATLLQLIVDRRQPGENDQVLLSVEWPDGTRQQIIFSECYELEAQMNFGVLAPESIRDARCCLDSAHLEKVLQRWKDIGVGLVGLGCFEISTNSTASAIRICARHFQVVPLASSGNKTP